MRQRMTSIRGAHSPRPSLSGAALPGSSSSSSTRSAAGGTPQIEGIPLVLSSPPPEGVPLPPPPPPSLVSPETHPSRRRRIEAGSSNAERGAIVPTSDPPDCRSCQVFIQSLGYLRDDRDKIREELEQARISERVKEERRRLAVVERRRMEGVINDMKLSYDRLREDCRALHLRLDAAHDPDLITGGRLVLNTLLEFGVITRNDVDSCGMSYFFGPS